MRALALLCLAAAARADPETARSRVRAFEAELQSVIARVSPAVGAVTCYGIVLHPPTGRVAILPRGQGSGVMIRKDGFFLTNVHVVEGAMRITVALPDGEIHEARLHADTSGGQVKGDIALLRLEGDSFPAVDWQKGEPGKLRPGDFVFAMGNPFAHAEDGTPVVTLGILSGKGRAPSESGFLYIDALQTDAEINPGNSGGPLFDSWGRLIGINGLIASRQAGFNSGVGWSIPIDQIRLFLKGLMKESGEGVTYGYHGLQVDSTPDESGALVVDVESGSPASAAGLGRNDVVYLVNGKKVRNRTDFVNIVGKLPEGTLVWISYRDDRTNRTTRFRLANFADRHPPETPGTGGGPRRPLPPERRGYLCAEYEAGPEGLKLTRIVRGGAAEAAGLKPGDLLVSVGATRLREGKTLFDLLAGFAPGEAVDIAFRRDGAALTASLKLGDAYAAAGDAP